MSQLFEVKLWVLIEAETQKEVHEKLDEVLGYAVRSNPDYINFGVDEVLTEEEIYE